MAPRRDDRRAGQGTRARLAAERDVARVREKAAARQRAYRERRKARLEDACLNVVESDGRSINIQRSSTRAAEDWAVRWFHETSGRGLEYQKALIPKILKHSIWQSVLPGYVDMEVAHSAVANISAGWQHIKGCHSKDQQRARNVIIPMLLSSSGVSARQTSLLTGIHQRNLKSGLVRRLALVTKFDKSLWAVCGRQRRVDALPPHVTKLVEDFWTTNTRISPNRKDAARKRIGVKEWINHPTHHLTESQLSLYTRFRGEHGGVEIGVRSFEALKSWFVKRMKEFNTCCCRYHVQMPELKDALNFMQRGTVHKNCSCHCDVCRPESGPGVCMASEMTVQRVTALCELVLCQKAEEQEYHALDCIRGDCAMCGTSKLKICPNEISNSTNALVSWKRFEMVFVGRGEDGNDRHALRLEHKMTPPSELVADLRSHLEEFLVHNFEAKWQDQQFKMCMGNLSPDAIVSVIDFAENYAFKWQNEVQSQHWFSFQVTILVHITFRVHPGWDGLNPHTKVLTEYHFYISDDKSHDNNFVQYCFRLHKDFLMEQGFLFPVEHIVFSDGCAAQFKCAKSLYFVARYPSLTRTDDLPFGCVMQWNHFGTGHGKGQWDRAGAQVKEALRREQVKPNGLRLHNSSDVVHFLHEGMNREYAGYHGARRSVHRYFYDVNEVDVNLFQTPNARTVDDTRSFHQVRSVGLEETSLQVRGLSCFCKFCMDGGDGPCDSFGYIEPFTLIRLEPCEPQTQTKRDRARLNLQQPRIHPRMSDRESLAATLDIGDHFVVLADDGAEGPEFWIPQCQEPLHAVEEDMKEDRWGQSVYRGEQIVIGTYNKQRGSSRSSYIREDPRRHAFIYSHLVVATKFDLPVASNRQKGGRGGTQVYKLTSEAHEHIHSQLLAVD